MILVSIAFLMSCQRHTPPAAPVSGMGRLSSEALDALGEPTDSPCRGYQPPASLDLGTCRAIGPFPGEIQGSSAGGEQELGAALETCAADPGCLGVSAGWYMGAPWQAVMGATGFQADEGSYGCTFVLDCR